MNPVRRKKTRRRARMNESSSSSGGGIGFLGLLQIVLITLRLLDVIGWSWWLVMLPTLIPLGFAALYFLLVVVPLVLRKEDRK